MGPYGTIGDYMGPYLTIGVIKLQSVRMYVSMYVSEFSINRVVQATKNSCVPLKRLQPFFCNIFNDFPNYLFQDSYYLGNALNINYRDYNLTLISMFFAGGWIPPPPLTLLCFKMALEKGLSQRML